MNRAVPKHLTKLYKRAVSGKSRKAAIRMQCIECMGYERAEVENCTDKGCPLFNYRIKG